MEARRLFLGGPFYKVCSKRKEDIFLFKKKLERSNEGRTQVEVSQGPHFTQSISRKTSFQCPGTIRVGGKRTFLKSEKTVKIDEVVMVRVLLGKEEI